MSYIGNAAANTILQATTSGPKYSTATYPTTAGTSGKVLISDGTNIVSSTPTFPNAATGTGTILRADGTNWVATTSTYPTTNAISTLLYASASNVMSALATANNGTLVTSSTGVPSVLAGPGTTGNIFQSNAAAAPSFSTATYPAIATTTGTILRADGTNWVKTTSTFADTYGASTILYSNGANTVAGLATANNAILATSATGVPSITTASGNWLNTSRSAFLATQTSAQDNLSINATTTFTINNEIFDQASDYNAGTYTFTAPVTGRYQLNFMIRLNGLDTATVSYDLKLVTSNRSYINTIISSAEYTSDTGDSRNISVLADMDAADTALCTVAISNNGSSQTDVQVDSGISTFTNFSGFLVC